MAIDTEPMLPASQPYWTVHRSHSPIVATAIHEGHTVAGHLEPHYGLSADERRREEDPFTEFTIRDVPNRIVFHRSRFEVDINRAREGAVYLQPEQAWGLSVWKRPLSASQIASSLSIHDDYYEMLHQFLKGIERRHGHFVVLDVHSYNHRRDGPSAHATDQAMAPDINIGTSSMDRDRWSDILNVLVNHFRSFRLDGRPLDVRENVAFQGKGEQTRFIHDHFPKTGCAIAVEFKKIFMDEWTGEPIPAVLDLLRTMVSSSVPLLEKALKDRR